MNKQLLRITMIAAVLAGVVMIVLGGIALYKLGLLDPYIQFLIWSIGAGIFFYISYRFYLSNSMLLVFLALVIAGSFSFMAGATMSEIHVLILDRLLELVPPIQEGVQNAGLVGHYAGYVSSECAEKCEITPVRLVSTIVFGLLSLVSFYLIRNPLSKISGMED